MRMVTGPMLIAIAWLGLLCGCESRPGRLSNYDTLRERVVELDNENDALRDRNAELEAELHAAAAGVPDSLPASVRAAIPHVTRIEIGRLSHLRAADTDAIDDRVILYIRSLDGLERFVQIVGNLSVHIALLPAEGEAFTIGRLVLSPEELRATYRSGITGTHYTIEVPITLNAESATECDARVVYIDGRSGQRFEAHRSIELK